MLPATEHADRDLRVYRALGNSHATGNLLSRQPVKLSHREHFPASGGKEGYDFPEYFEFLIMADDFDEILARI
jgi:hypothetical protein